MNFQFGLFQKKFIGKVSNGAVHIGCTKGRGSSTRMFNYCKQRSPDPSQCLFQFISYKP